MRILGTLALTHSSRRTNLARCSAEFLRRRFGDPERLRNLPPFEDLPPPQPLYSGAASFFRVVQDGREIRLRALGALRDREKIQHVARVGERDLLVGFEQRVERWRLPGPIASLGRMTRAGCTVVRRYEHPHLAGLHSVAPIAGGRAVLSCSAADAVLVLDLESGEVERTLRMPAALYGQGYPLAPEMDLRRHYIDDEGQTTHVNQAWPFDSGRRVLVSTLIQGAVGVFDLETGEYEEIARGFVGCHGARINEEGQVYFADSTSGHLTFLDEQGKVSHRFDAGSRWLHDVQQIAGSVYAFALADANELRVWDVDREELLFVRRFFTWPVEGLFGVARRIPGWLGNSTQALWFG